MQKKTTQKGDEFLDDHKQQSLSSPETALGEQLDNKNPFQDIFARNRLSPSEKRENRRAPREEKNVSK